MPLRQRPLSFPGCFLLAARTAGYLGGFTCAAIVDAPAEEVLRFLSTPADFPKVYTAIQVGEQECSRHRGQQGGGAAGLRKALQAQCTQWAHCHLSHLAPPALACRAWRRWVLPPPSPKALQAQRKDAKCSRKLPCFSSIQFTQSVEEVGAAAPGDPVTFVSHSVAHVLGLKVPAAIKMRLARSGELVRFSTLEPSGMISAMDGVNAVVALPPGSSSADMEVEVDKFLSSLGVAGGSPRAQQQPAAPRLPFASVALGLPAKFGVGPGEHGCRRWFAALVGPVACERGCSQHGQLKWHQQTTCLLAASPSHPCPPALPAGADAASKAAPAQQRERCLVVMHQRLKVKLCPPGMGKLLRSHLMGMHTGNLKDLLTWLGGRGRQ